MRSVVLCFCLVWLNISSVQVSTLFFTEGKLSSDSDEADQQLLVAGAGQEFESGFLSRIEVGGGNRKFADNLGSEAFDLLRLRLQTIKRSGWQAKLQLDYLKSDDWSPLVYGLTLSSQPHPRWYFELAAERDLVDTVAAVRNETLEDSYSLSADYKLSSSLTMVGAPLVQNFSDSNQRWGGVVRLIYSPPQYEKFSVELKGRLLKSDFAGVGYFSP